VSDEVDVRVARRLRDIRSRHGTTLSSVARLAGISSAHLSRLESGDRQPSIGTLLQLARVYGVGVGELAEEQDDRIHRLTRTGDRRGTSRGREGEYQVLTSDRSNLLAMRVTIDPGQVTLDSRHVGEEWIYVLSGPVTVTLDDEDIVLDTAESLHFDSARPHRLRAPRDQAADLLVVSAAGMLPAHHPLPRPHRD
jgi:transcriptional regulator with XRE-family HTH domain